MRHFLSLLLVLQFNCLAAQAFYFELSTDAKLAYEKTFSLRFTEAKAILSRMRVEEPNNLIVHHIENYMDFYKIYINEDEEEFKRLKPKKNYRLDQIKKGDPSSPYYLFLQADIRLHWALARLKFEEYVTSFTEVNKAYRQLKKNQRLFPDFILNLKDLGILHAMVGTIPDNYQWGVKLLSSLEGSIEQGQRELEQVLEYAAHNNFIFEQEAKMLYALLRLHLDNDKTAAWKIINTSGLQPDTNPLHCFVMANVAMRTGKNDQAISILENYPKGPAYYAIPYLDFMLGTAKLRKLDATAKEPLLSFINNYEGKNFIKEAYQKLAWNELVNGNPSGYSRYMADCKIKGSTVTGSDKNAIKEAESGILPEERLLKARLLFDGGYYKKAFNLLETKGVFDFERKAHQLEYMYRMGRICHGLKYWQKALYFYNLTIEKAKEEKYFFACNAALQVGLIYEQLDDYVKAKTYFQLCLSLKPNEYKTGLHQMAKAGLSRIKRRMKE